MNSLYLSVSCVLPTISKSWLLPGKCGLAGRGGAGCGGGEVGRRSLVKCGSRVDLWPFYGF